jgi:hypothetical protein
VSVIKEDSPIYLSVKVIGNERTAFQAGTAILSGEDVQKNRVSQSVPKNSDASRYMSLGRSDSLLVPEFIS